MPNFIINKNAQPNGDHEVHNITTGCSHLPESENQIDLGYHDNCKGAVSKGKKDWPNNKINGCYYCAKVCHTS